MAFDYDLFVIGAGSGGVRASRIASQLGARVAVAEDRYMGGTCVNVGCVPKKLFVYSSEFSESFQAAQGFGWHDFAPAKFDWPTMLERKNKEINRLNGIYEKILEGVDVQVFNGHARISGPNTVLVGDQEITSQSILIATGGWPNRPTFPGAEHVIDSNQFFHLTSLPKRVLIQGGGYIALEFAGILNGWGCETELVYRGDLFLRGFDQGIRKFTAEQIQEKGIRLSFSTDITSIEKQANGELDVQLNHPQLNNSQLNNGESRRVDAVISAVGRHANTQNLGLENTQVTLDERGFIEVDDHFQTKQAGIYAIGDVIGRVALTPVALAEGMALAKHLFAEQAINMDYDNIPTALFCQPNIGTVGLSEQDARKRGYKVDIYESVFKSLKNTLSGSKEKMMMKLIVNRQNDKVIGAHLVGPEAGEILQGIAIAIKMGATKADFDSTIGIHPTAAEEFVTMRTANS